MNKKTVTEEACTTCGCSGINPFGRPCIFCQQEEEQEPQEHKCPNKKCLDYNICDGKTCTPDMLEQEPQPDGFDEFIKTHVPIFCTECNQKRLSEDCKRCAELHEPDCCCDTLKRYAQIMLIQQGENKRLKEDVEEKIKCWDIEEDAHAETYSELAEAQEDIARLEEQLAFLKSGEWLPENPHKMHKEAIGNIVWNNCLDAVKKALEEV